MKYYDDYTPESMVASAQSEARGKTNNLQKQINILEKEIQAIKDALTAQNIPIPIIHPTQEELEIEKQIRIKKEKAQFEKDIMDATHYGY